MNTGLVVGFVNDKSGASVGGATVTLTNLRGRLGGTMGAKGDSVSSLGSPSTETDSGGYFALSFEWSGTDIAAAVGSGAAMILTLRAAVDVSESSSRRTSYVSPYTSLAGYMFKDTFAAIGLPNFQSIPDLLGFSKDLIDAYREMKLNPYYAISEKNLSTESWIIFSAGILQINKR